MAADTNNNDKTEQMLNMQLTVKDNESGNTVLGAVIIGGAHQSETGKRQGAIGDQLQTGATDYVGEVSMTRLTSAQFKMQYGLYTIYRFVNLGHAHDLASMIITACNNPNIGYGETNREGIFNYGVSSSTPTNCDAASLVSYCLGQVLRQDINTTVGGFASILPKLVDGSGDKIFMNIQVVSGLDFVTKLPYNGDILYRSGSDIQVVVAGSPRSGNADEITEGTWIGEGDMIKEYIQTNSSDVPYEFTIRTTAPKASNQYYQYSYGQTENGMYAWGRFSEILRGLCNLCRGIPRRWYVTSEDGYSRGPQIAPGAVMCWTNLYNLNDPGIVAIVEKVESNKVYLSWRHPTLKMFEYFAITQNPNGNWDMDRDKDGTYEYSCQGFIYNPMVNTGELVELSSKSFIKNAAAQVGNTGSYVRKYTDVIPKRDPWAAAFIVAVAKETGILDVVIPNTYSCSSIGKLGVTQDMGTWIDGPALGRNPNPHAGDIMLLRTTALKTFQDDNRYGADKAGIVLSVNSFNGATSGKNQTTSKIVEVVIGDVNDQVQKIQFETTSKQISGYFRPNWQKKDGYKHNIKQQVEDDGLYTEGTSMEDAAIRDLRYVKVTKKGLEPSIKSSGITLSAINYTGMIANFYTAFVESGTAPGYDPDIMADDSNYGNIGKDSNPAVESKTGYDPYTGRSTFDVEDGNSIMGAKGAGSGTTRNIIITPTVQTVYKELSRWLGTRAAAIGILGNILQENGTFDPGAVSKNGACGFCQWLGGRREEMKTYCLNNGGDFSRNILGQCGFIILELNRDLPQLFSTLQSVPDTLSGARTACDQFMRKFERCGNYDKEGPDRATWTEGFWQLLRGGGTAGTEQKGKEERE